MENARKEVQIYAVGVGYEIESLASKEEIAAKNLLSYLRFPLSLFIAHVFT